MDRTMQFIAVIIIGYIFFVGYAIYQLYKEDQWRKENKCIILSDTIISHDSYFPYRKTYAAIMDCNGHGYKFYHN